VVDTSDITHLTYARRFYNRAPKSRIELTCSLDEGKTWTRGWSLTDTAQPWDTIHYETAQIPRGHRSAMIKYLLNTTDPSPSGCGIYALRIEADHLPFAGGVNSQFPLEVEFKWAEIQKDRSLIERSHLQLVEKLPFKYIINVGGEDHPLMKQMTVSSNTL